MTLKIVENISKWLDEKNGILVTKSAMVYRHSYFGNNLIAQNDSLSVGDERGFVPVELWIMSTVEADNPIRKSGEGLTRLSIYGQDFSLAELKKVVGDIIFGKYSSEWPLAKILDIGGKLVKTSFGTTEIPPIPVHVHGGVIVDGKAMGPGKLEAYFFPPTLLPPYNKSMSAITRIGLKAGVTKENVKENLKEFGKSDAMYELLNEFPIRQMSSWTVPEGVLHSPGPHITFEIQSPQDDYNLSSWRLGERLDEQSRNSYYQNLVLRGLKDEDLYVDEVLDWQLTTSQDLEKKYFYIPEIIEEGSWGKRYQIFSDRFYGEGWEINPGQFLSLKPKEVPQAGIVWSGEGEVNSNPVSQKECNEFLCIPNTPLIVKNTSNITLFIYTVEPIRQDEKN